MPGKDNPKTEERAYRPQEETQASEMNRLLTTLDRVFSTFREQLQTEAPKPFTGNAKIAVETFNDIFAGLRFESRPRAVTITAKELSPTEIELTWSDAAANADGYRVERCEGYHCDDLNPIAQLASSERFFRDSHLSATTPYRYRVIAFNVSGETPSNIVDITPTNRRQEK